MNSRAGELVVLRVTRCLTVKLSFAALFCTSCRWLQLLPSTFDAGVGRQLRAGPQHVQITDQACCAAQVRQHRYITIFYSYSIACAGSRLPNKRRPHCAACCNRAKKVKQQQQVATSSRLLPHTVTSTLVHRLAHAVQPPQQHVQIAETPTTAWTFMLEL
jgi:hypothetical protein